MPKSTLLALSYTVDKRPGVGHCMYDGVRGTIFPFDIQPDPIARGCKGIDFAFHIL